jgi:hypothetical protein
LFASIAAKILTNTAKMSPSLGRSDELFYLGDSGAV